MIKITQTQLNNAYIFVFILFPCIEIMQSANCSPEHVKMMKKMRAAFVGGTIQPIEVASIIFLKVN